jgi:diguanylate cyclase (GGDEF)-like protein
MTVRNHLHRPQAEAVEIDLIRSVFHGLLPALVMTISFVAAGFAIVARTGDTWLVWLLGAGILASGARLLVAWRLAPHAMAADVGLDRARQLERWFAIPYLAFAGTLGLFGLRAFMLPLAGVHMLALCVLIVYCAGVAVGMGLRLRIALPAMVIALAPTVIAALATADVLYRVAGMLIASVLISATHILRMRHRRVVSDIALRIAFGNLARKDALTALPNRIGLREWFEERAARGGPIAVHYIDLNGFKPVNDTFGHPVGDALLIAVGKRIIHTIRDADIVARLGGDEFAVVQYGIHGPEDAALLAARLSAAIARPFRIGDRTINISTGLGYVLADGREADLDDLLDRADQALYASKRGGGIAQYDAARPAGRRHRA